jgi:hypothetical protein
MVSLYKRKKKEKRKPTNSKRLQPRFLCVAGVFSAVFFAVFAGALPERLVWRWIAQGSGL